MATIKISELEKFQESEKLDSIDNDIISILLTAINDWPNPIINIEDYLFEVENFINGEITKEKLESCLSQIDFSKDSWQSESLYQLIDVFQFYDKGISLTYIVKDLEVKLRDGNILY